MYWSYAFTADLWPLLLTVFLLLTLTAYSWRRRDMPGAPWFAAGALLAALWSAGALMERASTDVATQIAWIKFQSILKLPATTAIFIFILDYAWPGRWVTRRNLAFLFSVPVIYTILALTNDLHSLVWQTYPVDGRAAIHLGPAAWIFLVYSFILGVMELIVLGWLFRRSPPHRWPAAIMVAGQVGARALYILDLTNAGDFGVPLEILAIDFIFLMYGIALYAFHILDPVSLARQAVCHQLQAGIVIVSPQGQVTNLNPAAEAILGCKNEEAIGQTLCGMVPAHVCDTLANLYQGQVNFSQSRGGTTGYYNGLISPLYDWRGLEVGRLLLIHDVTEQRQAQEQLVEQQRAVAMLVERERLARELHDSLGQILSFINAQGQTVQRLLARGDLETANSYVERIVQVAYEADVDIREWILGLCARPSGQGLRYTMEQFLTRYERNYGINAELYMEDGFTDRSFEPQVEVHLLRILQEALTNVRKHAGANRAWIEFAAEDGFARVSVRDDGDGFDPAIRTDRLDEHVGLRMMSERAKEVGGSLSVASKPGQGTSVVLRVPRKIPVDALT